MKNKLPKTSFGKNFRVLMLVFKYCPVIIPFALLYIASCVVSSLIKVILVKDAVSLILGGSSFNILLSKVIVFVIIDCVALFFKVLYEDYIEGRCRNVYIKRIQHYLYLKVREIDMEEYDNPEFYNRYSKALRDSQWRGFRVYGSIIKFIKNVCVTIAIGGYIITSDLILICIVVISAILIALCVNRINKLWYEQWKTTENEQRFYWYINRTFYQQRYAAEIKTTNISNLLIDKYVENSRIVDKKRLSTYKKAGIFSGIRVIINQLVIQAGSYIYLGYKLFKGLISLDAFSANINATLQFSSSLIEAISIFTELREHALYIDDFLWVVAYEPTLEVDEGIEVSSFNSLEIKDLSFSYKGTKKDVIKNLDLTINKGEHIALVGVNGSGKTTLIKLILRFYKQTDGLIYYNGISYDDINPKKLRNNFSVIFQDYQIYAVSVAENILMRKVNSQEDLAKAWEALEKVGLKEKVLSLPDGINTQMTREFEESGASFSGGERQRLVIARVFASDADVYILDEPTAALDPFAEEKINKLIISESSSKTIIIIAHRLSSVVDCDRIYLLNGGRFTEKGSHEELLKLNGDYANMFNTQKHLYEKRTDME